ncbi:MAG: YqaJ viral recombinase family protein [Planctomycetota bacterium]
MTESMQTETSGVSTQRIGEADWPANWTGYDSREQWLQGRRHSIGASEVFAVITGKGANQVWLAKTRPEDVPDVMTEMDSDIGHALEPVAAKWFAREMDAEVIEPTLRHCVWYDPECPRLTATPDFLVTVPEQGRGLMEAKTFSRFMRPLGSSEFSGWDERAPMKYAMQCAAQLSATSLPFVWLYGIQIDQYGREPGKATIRHLIEPNAAFQDLMRQRVTQFWDRYVQRDVPPPAGPDPSAERVLRILYPEAKPATVYSLPPSLDHYVTRWDELDEQLGVLTDERDRIKREVMSLAKDAEEIRGAQDGERLWTYRDTKRGRQFRRSGGRKSEAS